MKIFFSGIGGSGVSAIAGFMAEKGHAVSGSDRLFDAHHDHPVRRRLQANGIVIVPQNGRGIDQSFDLAVFSTAVEQSNPDVRAAEASGVPIKTRPQYLADIVSAYRTIAVAGTSGKSTTSGLLAYLMQRLGLFPNFIGGGRVKQFRTDRNPGNYIAGSSEELVIEACESDGTIVWYEPQHALILNLDLDHHSVEETAKSFQVLSARTSGDVHLNADDLNLRSCNIRGARTFSIAGDSACRAEEIRYYPFSTSFVVHGQKFELSLPGRHNLYNALACISVLAGLGISLKEIAEVLPDFTGIERRFDVHLNDGRGLVIDDYAHNPHKIRSLMETMRAVRDRICYIFQPHGFGPTRLMKDGYIAAFREGLRADDRLILLPIYYAGGTAAKDISSDDIAGPLRASGKIAAAVHDRKEVFGFLREFDAYVVFGARDDSLSGLAEEIAKRLG
ncbi:MAG TPA: Mur ligase domain-containing protein [Thermodesulfovibrionales bacterium]|nr:Mur ligase domain-containing protein [Thermodesulfovibrionales bacterium]